ncbi:MAG: sulfatase [Planctomycetes bacterium]|nr:sulfatase [Planctomycetota bacterium]MBI3844475.1 sulfatase [Planctomycetota bacterium]
MFRFGKRRRIGKRVIVGLAIAAPIIALSFFLACGRAPRLNVVLMSIDSLRPDHLRCYGYSRDTSHAIDGLAAEGVRFRTAISTTSWTLPAHAALLTGLPDYVHGCLDNGFKLDDERTTTLAALFRKSGYRTAGFASGPYLAPMFGFKQGFDEYVNCSSMSEAAWNSEEQTPDGITAMNDLSHSDVTSPRVLKGVMDFLGSAGNKPFFLFLHWWDVHFDYEPPAPYDTEFDPDYHGWVTGKNVATDARINKDMPEADKKHLIALYDGEIAWTDHHIGLVIDELKRRGFWENTIVVVTADHGEEFFEHDGKGHQQSLYDEVIKIPLIIRWPKGPANRVIGGQVRITDVLQTLVERTGIAGLPGSSGLFSRDLEPFTRDGADPPELPAFSELRVAALDKDYSSLRQVDRRDAWKAFESFRKPMGRAFWDLERNPREEGFDLGPPRAKSAFEKLEGMRELFDAIGNRRRGARGFELTDEMKRLLRSFGYLVGGDPKAANDEPADASPGDGKDKPTDRPHEKDR